MLTCNEVSVCTCETFMCLVLRIKVHLRKLQSAVTLQINAIKTDEWRKHFRDAIWKKKLYLLISIPFFWKKTKRILRASVRRSNSLIVKRRRRSLIWRDGWRTRVGEQFIFSFSLFSKFSFLKSSSNTIRLSRRRPYSHRRSACCVTPLAEWVWVKKKKKNVIEIERLGNRKENKDGSQQRSRKKKKGGKLIKEHVKNTVRLCLWYRKWYARKQKH